MQKSSIKRYSLLGLVLIAASAVTAAVLPSKLDKNSVNQFNGSLTQSKFGASITCEATDQATEGCNVTASNTSNGNDTSDLTGSGINGNTTTAG